MSCTATATANGPPEPKFRVTVRRTPDVSFGGPSADAPVPPFSLTALSQSVFFGLPENVVFAQNCRLWTGETQFAVAGSSPHAAVSTGVVAVVRPAGVIRSSGRDGNAGAGLPRS